LQTCPVGQIALAPMSLFRVILRHYLIKPVTSSQWAVAGAVIVGILFACGLAMLVIASQTNIEQPGSAQLLHDLGLQTMLFAALIGIVGLVLCNLLMRE